MGKKSRAASKKKSTKSSGSSSGNGSGSGGSASSNKKKNKQADPFGAEEEGDAYQKSIYHVYKAATLSFKETLASLVPKSMFKDDYVQSFVDAADYIQDNNISVDHSLIRNLRLAISVRKKYSERLVDGGDEGHAYFLLVLNYCLTVLNHCKTDELREDTETEKVKDACNEEEPDKACSNRFGALSLEDHLINEESDSEDEGDDDTPTARPEPPQSKKFSFNDLISFPDKARCMFLFDAMAWNACKFTIGMRNLKETMRMEANGEYPTDGVIRELIAIGVLSKSILLDVEHLENELYIECPELGDSPYRILACCFMEPISQIVSHNIRTNSPLSRKFKDSMALAFVGDIIEAVFRFEMDEVYKISDRFSKRWKLPEHWSGKLKWLSSVAVHVILENIKTEAETKLFPPFVPNGIEDFAADIPEWMEENEFWEHIGGDCSIFNTMRLLDGFGSLSTHSEDGTREHPFQIVLQHIICIKGWDEQDNPAHSIREDMDSVLLKMLMSIVSTKWLQEFNYVVPMERKMLPLVHYMRNWMLKGGMKSKPPFALIFALHMILVSLFEIQGDKDVSRVASIAKETYNRFYSQSEQHLKLDIPCESAREECLSSIVGTKRVAEALSDPDIHPEIAKYDILFWNPLMSGLFLGYTNIYLSLRGGLAAMTTSNDTRIVLHIYNALKDRGMIIDGLPLLSDIDRYFDRTMCFWNGWEKPCKGKYTYRFHLSMGSTHELATWLQDKARYKHEGGDEPGAKPKATLSKLKHNRKTSKRVSVAMEPATVSDAYKYICTGDFGNIEDKMQGQKVPQHLKIDPTNPFPLTLQMQEAKLYLICQALISEFDGLLQYNLVAVGTICSQLLFETFHPDRNEVVARVQARPDLPFSHPGDVRSIVNAGIVEEILAGLDYCDEDTYAFLAEAFEDFFINLDMDRVLLHNCGD